MSRADYWSKVLEGRIARRRALSASASAALGAAFLAACGGDSSEDDTDSAGLVTKPVDSTKEAKRGGVMKDRLFADPPTLDLLTANNPLDGVGPPVYSALLQMQPGYLKPPEFAVMPDIAESWETSGDGLQLTMKIRQGVKWHNVAPVSGRAMDMGDVIFSWERFAAKYSGRSGIVNAVNPDAPVLSLQAVDSRTISIRLKEPLSYVLGLFAAPGAYFGNYLMAPKETDTTVDLRGTMIGTGPLMMTNYTPSVGFTLKRHPDHWDSDRILVDQVEKPIISEYAAARDQFKAGNMYTFGSHPTSFGVNQEDVLSLKRDEPRISVYQTDLKASGGPGVMSLGWLPEGRSPYLDERVRQAFSMAIDRDLFIDVFSNVSKFRAEGIPVDTRWSTALSTAFTTLSEGWWLDPKGKDFGPNAKFFAHDVNEAKKLMAAAGYANGFQTTFHFPPPSILPYAKPAEVIGGMTSDIGIRATYHELDYQKEYIPEYRDGKGQFDGVGFVTNAGGFSGGHPIGYIAIEYWSKGGAAFRGFSASGKNDQAGDPQVETMIEKARLERDTEKAKALVSDLQRYLAKSMYAINGLGAATELTVAWPCVGNYRVYSGNHLTHFYRLWLDQTKPPFTTA